MNQEETNAAEWSNPDNWSSPKWVGLYFSKKDQRAWVPKPIPALGWTLNLGRPKGVFWALAIVVGTVIVATFAGYFAST